ncbi:MAG TPA: ATP-binding protein, partial [Methylomirabilota bacterium]|nr:ATP-binding protein [Methylomirabilota bacterium]
PQDAFLGGRAFESQERIVARNAGQADPEHANLYAESGARSVIAAPITAEDRRIGVLIIYADRSPVFIEDDLWLLELLADQSAILLEARALAGEAHELRAREGAARLKEEFLSAAAHDLRTPLTVVLGQAELLERRLERDPSAAVDAVGVGRMAREARRLGDLVSELLDAQRLEQGGAVIQRVQLDVREIVRRIHERHADQKPAFAVVLPDEPLLASVDRRRLEQVLDNLIENAAKYSPGAAAPEVRAWAEGDEVRVSVIDYGVGIPAAEREHVFGRFYRASNVQGITDTGLGLGLFICQRIVEAHDGRIWVDETPGGGSTFTLSLPRDLSVHVEASPRADDEWSLSHAGKAVTDA